MQMGSFFVHIFNISMLLFCLSPFWSFKPQAAQAQNTRSYIQFYFYLYANVQRNVTCDIYYYLTIKLDHAKHDSRLAAYGGVVLQRLEGLNLYKFVCERNGFAGKVNSAYNL